MFKIQWSRHVHSYRHLILLALFLAIPLLLISCGPETPKYTTDKPWSEMDYDARLIFMGTKVFAPIKKLFQEHDPVKFKDFKCETCHGADGPAKKYKMPNGIYPLDPSKTDGEDKVLLAFMKDKVLPEFKKIMATSGQTKTNCLSCHASK